MGDLLINLALNEYFDVIVHPYFLQGSSILGQLSIIGSDRKGINIDAFFACTVLRQLSPYIDKVIVPEVPGHPSEHLPLLLSAKMTASFSSRLGQGAAASL